MAERKPTTKKKGQSTGPKNIDWPRLRDEYTFDATVTYSDLAEKYGVSITIVKRHGAIDRWPEVRAKLAEKAYEDFQQKMLDEKSRIQSEQLDNYAAMSQLVMQTTRSMIDKGAQLKDKSGNVIIDPDTDQPMVEQMDAFQLEKLARALDIAEKGRRVVLGLPTAVNGVSNADGGSVWQGLSDLAEEAKKVIDAAGQSSAS